jgi:hypothetical protein
MQFESTPLADVLNATEHARLSRQVWKEGLEESYCVCNGRAQNGQGRSAI